MDTRESVTRELLGGATPYQLSKKYPKKSVYRIYNELVASGQLPEHRVIAVDSDGGENGYPFIPATSTRAETQELLQTKEVRPDITAQGKETRADVIDIGEATLPISAVNRIRGILGITIRPKVLSMPTPELLYPAMVISVNELGFPPMRPDDFIDTVLYQWLDACDYIPYAYIKKSEIEEIARNYSTGRIADVEESEIVPQEVEYEEPDEVLEAEPEESEDELEESDEQVDTQEQGEDILGQEMTEQGVKKEVETEPHKPTVGDFLKMLHISNLREVEHDSTERGESNNP